MQSQITVSPQSPDAVDDSAFSRRSLGKRLLLGASAVAVLLASGKHDAAQAAPLTDDWHLGGNLAVNTDGTNFIGTRNVAPLVFKTAATNNVPTERMRITPAGNVGIGTVAPAVRLHVEASTTTAIVGRHSVATGAQPGVQGDTLATVAGAIGVYGLIRPTSPGADSAGVRGTNSGTNANGAGVRGSHAGSGSGVYGTAVAGIGVYGSSGGDIGVYGFTSKATGSGVYGSASGGGAAGVFGTNPSGPGVWGRSNTRGVYGESVGGIGVYGTGSGEAGVFGVTTNPNGSGVEGNAAASNAAGVFGENTVGPGVWGRGTNNGRGVLGQSTGGYGVNGISTSSTGVHGQSTGGYGASGVSNTGLGVYGQSTSNGGVYGLGYIGVQGNTNGTQESQAIRGENNGSNTVGYAGYFNGRVTIVGTLSKSAGSFKIDHPLDPENRYLSHSFVESPDMMNVYNGNVTLDAQGAATVEMPGYFEALNRDFRYQLTAIGAPGPNLYIAEEISANRFKIAGGKPGTKVSWLVTGIRQDVYANGNRIPVEEDKPKEERGRYVYPQGYGKTSEQSVAARVRPV